jgi:hypothetical protein
MHVRSARHDLIGNQVACFAECLRSLLKKHVAPKEADNAKVLVKALIKDIACTLLVRSAFSILFDSCYRQKMFFGNLTSEMWLWIYMINLMYIILMCLCSAGKNHPQLESDLSHIH